MENKRTLFLIDDDEDDRMFLRSALEDVLSSVRIIEFVTAEEALKGLEQEQKPSLILMDINMPKISGVQALSTIRTKTCTKHIPVVLFSTSSDPAMIREAYVLGVNAYIVKPTSMEGYLAVARAIKMCFFHTGPFPEITKNLSRAAKRTILVIEDNADHWDLMRLSLANLDKVKLVHLKTAGCAMDFLRNEYLDYVPAIELIVLDLYLPERQQGLDLIEHIRSFFISKNLPPVPVIIFSASALQEDIVASYQRQANVYITKSYDLAQSAFHLKDVCMAWSRVIALPG